MRMALVRLNTVDILANTRGVGGMRMRSLQAFGGLRAIRYLYRPTRAAVSLLCRRVIKAIKVISVNWHRNFARFRGPLVRVHGRVFVVITERD